MLDVLGHGGMHLQHSSSRYHNPQRRKTTCIELSESHHCILQRQLVLSQLIEVLDLLRRQESSKGVRLVHKF